MRHRQLDQTREKNRALDTDTEQQRKKGQKDKEWKKESVRETNIKIVKEDDSERDREIDRERERESGGEGERGRQIFTKRQKGKNINKY